ncbi:hypothetical protein OQA88_8595 [Cercophora sp. LCS_1]
MKLSAIATTLMAFAINQTAAAPAAESVTHIAPSAIDKRANWSFTPYAGNSCVGTISHPGGGWTGRSSNPCNNFSQATNSVRMNSDICRITLYTVPNCPRTAWGTTYGYGSNGCFSGNLGYQSFKVDCL